MLINSEFLSPFALNCTDENAKLVRDGHIAKRYSRLSTLTPPSIQGAKGTDTVMPSALDLGLLGRPPLILQSSALGSQGERQWHQQCLPLHNIQGHWLADITLCESVCSLMSRKFKSFSFLEWKCCRIILHLWEISKKRVCPNRKLHVWCKS